MRTNTRVRRGTVLIYVIMAMVAFLGFCSLGVDYGHVAVARSQLQQAADAGARFGAAGLENVIYGTSAAVSNAVAAAADCQVDGTPLVLDPTQDVEIGIWDSSARTFTPNSDPTLCNAVRVTAQRIASRGTAISLAFAGIIGHPTQDMSVSSIAVVTGNVSAAYTIPATGNPFLAGEPAGTMASPNNPHNNPDYAGDSGNPRQSPTLVNAIHIAPGMALTLDGINGGANNDFHDSQRYTADGNLGQIVSNTAGSEHGIANMNAPINSMVGVFLSDATPDGTQAPASLDFSTDASRDFQTLSPQLQQMFFIGDGRRDDGETQSFIAPPGATRFFITTWDAYEWNNNVGSFNFTVHQPGQVTTVK